MMTKPTKQPRPIDLSEYADEAVPFDAVILKLAKIKPSPPAKHKAAKVARKRK